jgi:hypothetical protein
MEVPMKRWMVAGGCLAFAALPLSALACGSSYTDAALSASAAPASRVAMSQTEASALPASMQANTIAPKDMKKVVSKVDQSAKRTDAPAARR